MKKKISAFVLVAALACSTVLSAFAAGSKTSVVEDAVASNGAVVEIEAVQKSFEDAGIDEAGNVAEEIVDSFVDVIKAAVVAAPENFAALTATAADADKTVVDVEVIDVFDVDVPALASGESVDIEFTLAAPIADGETPIVMHFDGEEWEALPTEAVSATVVKATFTEFSPVAIVTVTETPAVPVADKTADAVALVAIVALVAAGALVINRKRVNA